MTTEFPVKKKPKKQNKAIKQSLQKPNVKNCKES